jgi:hypothetical protein
MAKENNGAGVLAAGGMAAILAGLIQNMGATMATIFLAQTA